MRNCNRKRMKSLSAFAGLTCAALVFHGGLALSDQVKVPTAATLIEALKSKGPTRGVSNTSDATFIKALKDKSSRGLTITSDEREKLSKVAEKLPAYDMDILFEYNSAEISPGAKPSIDALGKALQDNELKGASFLVAGHTDASGGPDYNQKLSERRATAVREFLVSHYQLSSEQLLPVGYGPQQLKNPGDPFGGENRRVQIVNLGE